MSDLIRGCDEAAERQQEQSRLLLKIVNLKVFELLQKHYTNYSQDGFAVFKFEEYSLLIWKTQPQIYPQERRNTYGYSLDVSRGVEIEENSPQEFIGLYLNSRGDLYGSIDRVGHNESDLYAISFLIENLDNQDQLL